MKNRLRKFLPLLFALGTVWAQTTILPPPPDKDPMVGVWVKNKDKSQPITSGDYVFVVSYHSQTITREGEDIVIAERRGPSKWCCSTSAYEIKTTDWSWRLRCDGDWHPVLRGSISCRYTAPNTIEGKRTHDRPDVLFQRHTTSFWRIEISADGKEMKDTSYKDAAMTKLVSVTVYDRVK